MPKSNHQDHRRRECMDPGILKPLVDEFAAHLRGLRYTPLTVRGYIDSARHFAEWLNLSDATIVDVNEAIARFSQHHCRCSGYRQYKGVSYEYVSRVKRFGRFLVARGTAMAAEPEVVVVPRHITEFQDLLRQHRGISERTIARHGRMVARLLPALGEDPGTYDAELVRRVILEEAQRTSRPYIKTMMTALRGYLRFLAAQGLCRPWLDRAVPLIPQWRLSALPRYLPLPDVERLIGSCDLAASIGIRDRAILLLLARLGLRAGDIRNMRLDDVAWDEGSLRVCGKGRREVRLPLPQDAGDALLHYLESARPTSDDDRIFLCSKAPFRPFAHSSVIAHIVGFAIRRAGIANAPSKGANLLRHSAATAMLRGGATLDAVATVLRHRSTDMTGHYAKVDIPMLQQIAQPWPGGRSC